ncbi:hypothetical protein ASPBRDRAFT_40185 [Aspergillus brasiliensis CBS 101740]|uniref:Uncharacterized protein n=1 Tax=Aspergillus brasiliensis (strain CBS 101740 / IMI 381727 / IBT 21946) TaxID=767769 RepID=A0A1L9UT77_ASPBC|nr:hypothetical protein ASPBRDRAFT_40185 [Aspergillus brasiliensis CBS 101740]
MCLGLNINLSVSASSSYHDHLPLPIHIQTFVRAVHVYLSGGRPGGKGEEGKEGRNGGKQGNGEGNRGNRDISTKYSMVHSTPSEYETCTPLSINTWILNIPISYYQYHISMP